jgi:hypothetical protein
MPAACLITACIGGEGLGLDTQLPCHEPDQGQRRGLADAECKARKAQVAESQGKTDAVVIAALASDDS